MSLSLQEQLAAVKKSLKPAEPANLESELNRLPDSADAVAANTDVPTTNRLPANMMLDSVYEDFCARLDEVRHWLIEPVTTVDMTNAVMTMTNLIRDYNGKKEGTVTAIIHRAVNSVQEGFDEEDAICRNFMQSARQLLMEAAELVVTANMEVANPDALNEDEERMAKSVNRAEAVIAAATTLVALVKAPVVFMNESGTNGEQRELSTIVAEQGFQPVPYLQHIAIADQKLAVCTDPTIDSDEAKRRLGRAIREYNTANATTYCIIMSKTKFKGYPAAWVVDSKSIKASLNNLHLKWVL